MRTRLAILAATLGLGALCLGACATAGGGIDRPKGALVLAPGRKLTVRLDADNNFTLVSSGPAGTGAIFVPDASKSAETWTGVSEDKLPKPTPSLLTLYMWTDPKLAAVVVMANGTDRDIVYAANIVGTRDGQPASAPTTICTVLAHHASAEQWPDQLREVDVLRFINAPNPTSCLDGRSNRFYQVGRQPPTATPRPVNRDSAQGGPVIS